MISYALVTPARNEDSTIGMTIESVCSQTLRPTVWIIIDDGSTDKTKTIIEKYALTNSFIKLLSTSTAKRSMNSRNKALNYAFETIRDNQFDFIGVLDADITLPIYYYEELIKKFIKDKNLGIAGGARLDLVDKKFVPVRHQKEHVCGAVQFFSANCFNKMHEYIEFPRCGSDGYARLVAHYYGFATETFGDLPVFHHRRTAEHTNITKHYFLMGRDLRLLGYHPVWLLLNTARLLFNKPFLLCSLAQLSGFIYSIISRDKMILSQELLKFQRSSQLRKLLHIRKDMFVSYDD